MPRTGWNDHVLATRKKNPTLTVPEAMKAASATYQPKTRQSQQPRVRRIMSPRRPRKRKSPQSPERSSKLPRKRKSPRSSQRTYRGASQAVSFFKEEHKFTSYTTIIKSVTKKANELEGQGNEVIQIQIDTYKPWYETNKTKSTKTFKSGGLLAAFANTAFEALDNMKELSSVTIFYKKRDGPKKAYINSEHVVGGPFATATAVAKDVARMLSELVNTEVISLNYDSYMTALDRNRSEQETSVVSVFFRG